MLDVDPKAIQQINFNLNIDQTGQTAMYFIIEKAFSGNFWKYIEYIVVLTCFNILVSNRSYNTLNVKLCNSQLNKLKTGMKKNGNKVPLTF